MLFLVVSTLNYCIILDSRFECICTSKKVTFMSLHSYENKAFYLTKSFIFQVLISGALVPVDLEDLRRNTNYSGMILVSDAVLLTVAFGGANRGKDNDVVFLFC